MNAFDKVIGYESIKKELLQICDMIHHPEIYRDLGARMPKGILLYGEPGLGKTLMAKCFVEESGLKAYTLRRNKNKEDFIDKITETFKVAKENAPAVVFLDDMDKFANEDRSRRDAEEYVAVQAGFDDTKEAEVFVFATANDINKLPDSLIRTGRFDRKIEIYSPEAEDARNIIKHYLKDKKVSPDVNLEDLSMMMEYNSCAELEAVLNEAAINAAHGRKSCITMKELTEAVLRMEYGAPENCTSISTDKLEKTALHEAGHLVICEVLCPGSVGIASLRKSDRHSTGGFVRRCKELDRRPYHILVSLGGKAAVELYYAEAVASGCQSDIHKAVRNIREAISDSGTCGLGMVNVEKRHSVGMSENMNARTEALIQAELERYMLKAKDILLKNRQFLERTVEMLLEKETLMYSDIRALRESVLIQKVSI